MTVKELSERIAHCLSFENYCVYCREYCIGRCGGAKDLLEQTQLVLEDVMKNGMANN